MASAAVLPRALPLELVTDLTIRIQPSVSTLAPPLLGESSSNLSVPLSSIPDTGFTVSISIESTLMPVNAVLVNILNFMGTVATQDFKRKLSPRKYSATHYRDVEITVYEPTEARFLIWGIYTAVVEMVKIVRFNVFNLELNWNGNVVGRIKVALRQTSSADLAQTNSRDTDPVPVVGNVTDEDSVSLTSSSINGTDLSIPPGFYITFDSIVGAGLANRNDVFLTFYNALGHVAQFPAQDSMVSFQSESPNGKLHLHMQDVVTGCTYEETITALVSVPEYMMEHPRIGYRETDFLLKLRGHTACLGTLLKQPQPVERQNLEESWTG